MKQAGGPSPLLNSSGPKLQYIIEKVSHLATLNEALQKVLEPPLREHCRAANLKDGCLIIETDSPVWATPLRFQLPFILQKLRPLVGLYGIQQVSYYIQQPSAALLNKRKTAPSVPPHLSSQSAQILKETALTIEHTPLREALLRLALHGGEAALLHLEDI